MVKANTTLTKLKQNYLFQEIENKLSLLKKENPTLKICNLGIGDITHPISPSIVDSICFATKELSCEKTLKGYGPSEGDLNLRKSIKKNEYNDKISEDEIFISIGTKNDISSIQELFTSDNIIAIPDPAYPVYTESNILTGKNNIIYLPCTEENDFLPIPPDQHCDIVYLCSPNNPTGSAFSKEKLQDWVNYAKKHDAIILYDGAYEAFISDSIDVPRSIYELKNADEVAIEFRSFSKTAGFTSLRLSYMVIPKKLKSSDGICFNELWKRRSSSTFGGASYPIQKGGEAIYSDIGKIENKKIISYYKENAKILKEALIKQGFSVFGGDHSPYLWCKTLNGLTSWEFFDLLLNKGIITTPGAGFGSGGEGFIRLSAFAKRESILHALEIIKTL